MDWAPHVTVAAIIERDGQFLLVDEVVDGNRVLNQPAGHLDEGETLIDAVIRETLEETAWHFRPSALVGVYRWRQPGGGHTFLRVAFSGEVTAHDPDRKLDAGIIKSVWMTASQLASAKHRLRSPMVLRCVDDYRSGARHSLSIVSDIV
ncbi:MAG: NUDIX hydrolase [Gammaproteobacteria bacterium]|nr:NUDIX hydrolase [Gammaproteobacteria bacterium]